MVLNVVYILNLCFNILYTVVAISLIKAHSGCLKELRRNIWIGCLGCLGHLTICGPASTFRNIKENSRKLSREGKYEGIKRYIQEISEDMKR